MPYRTGDNRIDGVVITFADITASKATEADLRKTQVGMQERIDQQEAKLDQAGKK